MLHVGDLIVYSAHGICQIDDICDKTFSGVTRTYYVLHPLEGPQLTINIPAGHEAEAVSKLIDKDEAGQIIDSFGQPGIEWVENNHQRALMYHEIINTGSRKEISKVVNTLMRKKQEAEASGRKLGVVDVRMLTSVQKILFAELAISLDATVEAIEERVTNMIRQQE